MHQSLQAACAVASPLPSRQASRHVAPASQRRTSRRAPRAVAPCASVGAFAAAAPSDGGATVAWLAGQAVAAAVVLGAYVSWESKAAAQSRVDTEVRRRPPARVLANAPR